ncbi:MAG TPA: thioredoxin [Tissierellales bacterium]|nr:thioredoxin [Tissierellales bacterium]
MKDINDDTFNKEVLESDIPVVVDFWAPWCEPCKALVPVLEELDNQYSDRIKFVKLNVDENTITAQQFRILSIPTIKIFKNGEKVERITGFKSKNDLEKVLNKYV